MTDTDPRADEVVAESDQRSAEAELVRRIRDAGDDAADPTWLALRVALVEYGYAVLVAWAVTGELGRRVHSHGGAGRCRVPATLRLDRDAAHALAVEVLIMATDRFRRRSLPRWDPVGPHEPADVLRRPLPARHAGRLRALAPRPAPDHH